MKTRNKRKLLYILIIAGVLIVCIVFGIQIVKIHQSNKELEQRKERLERLVEEESKRAEELDDEEEYVKTKEFIEQKAKSIGYVYPDEIIFKKEN